MDKINWMKNIKKALLVIFFSFIVFVIFVLITKIIREWENVKIPVLSILIIISQMAVFITVSYIIIYAVGKITNSGKEVKTFNKNYIREIPIKYSPAIVSLIYDLKIDVDNDYTATLLRLCTKKYIHIQKDGDKYKLNLGEQANYANLDRCEKYVLDIIVNNNKFDEQQFKQEIIKEAKEKRLIVDKRTNINKIKGLLFLLVVFILLIMTNKIMSKFMWLYLCMGVFIIAYFYIGAVFNKRYKNIVDEYIRTSKGKRLAKVSAGLKNFIKEYTLIKDKEIDYIKILEDYIPYAIALNEADTIEEFVKHNEEYRNLIYNREINNSY